MTSTSRLVLLLATLYMFFVAICAAPIPSDETDGIAQALDKRVTHYGQGTWFYPGLGACGYTDGNDDPIVAISADIYGSGGNCDQWIYITNTDNGHTTYGRTRDECESCAAGSLDMSPSLFEDLGNLDTGVIPIEWSFMPMDWSP